MPAKLFFCYAHEDEALLQQLKRQLAPLQRQGQIEIWYDRAITPGASWEQEIHQQLDAADIIVFLVSPDSLASDYCYSVEMQRAIERHQRGEVQIIPVILRPVHWQTLFGQFQVLPPGGTPITDPSWHTQDKALFEVAEGIRSLLEQSLPKKPPTQDPVASAHEQPMAIEASGKHRKEPLTALSFSQQALGHKAMTHSAVQVPKPLSASAHHHMKLSPTASPKTPRDRSIRWPTGMVWRIGIPLGLVCVVILALVIPSLVKGIPLLTSQSGSTGGRPGDNGRLIGGLPADTLGPPLTGEWHSIPDQTLGRNDNFMGLSASSANAIWAVGNFGIFSTSPGLSSGGFMARWNGTHWLMTPSPRPSPQGDTLSAVVSLSSTDAWAIGYYLCVCTGYRVVMDHWDGTSWKLFRGPNKTDWNQVLTAVAGSASNDVWAVGNYTTDIGTSNTQPLIEHWDGTSWSLVNSPPASKGGFSGVAAIAPNDAWAIGDANGQAIIEQWDGHTWHMMSYPAPDRADRIFFNGITRIAGTNQLWLVGSYSTGPGTHWQTVTERYNGTQWVLVPSADVTGQDSILTSVSALAANNAWAVGYSGTHNLNQGKTLTEHWNGVSWQIVKSPNTSTGRNNDLAAVAMIPGTAQVFAVGTNEYGNNVGGFSTFSLQYT